MYFQIADGYSYRSALPSFPTRRSSDLATTLSSLTEWRRVYGPPEGRPPQRTIGQFYDHPLYIQALAQRIGTVLRQFEDSSRSEEHTSELQSHVNLVCRRLLEK